MGDDTPPCPRCGETYDRHVEYEDTWNVTGVTIDSYSTLCSTGLGVYLHE